jgi:hypothetical protein
MRRACSLRPPAAAATAIPAATAPTNATAAPAATARRRRRRRPRTSAIIAALAAAGALSDVPQPVCRCGPQSTVVGPLTLVRDIAQYVAIAAGAQCHGFDRFGNVCVAGDIMSMPDLTPPGGLTVKVDPTPEALLPHAAGVVTKAQLGGTWLRELRVGKCSIYGPGAKQWLRRGDRGHVDPYDFFSWDLDSYRRLIQHAGGDTSFAATILVGVFASERNALDAEKYLAERLGSFTGLATLNPIPYTTGHVSGDDGAASHFGVYVQVR